MADASQDEHEATFKFIDDIHNCPTPCSVQKYKAKQTRQWEQLGEKLGFLQTFLFLHRNAVSRSCCKLRCVVILRIREFDL